MSGNSKWANIQHRKGRQDAKRSNLWTKLVREIIVAARMGGGEPETNARLRLALIKARAGNVPKDTITNAILKGTGQLEGVSYEEVRYEGYGIGGAALIIDCTTDNRVRTVADVRHALTKHGGNLGTEGSVSFMFKHIGEFVFAPGVTTEDAVMESALEAGHPVSDEDGCVDGDGPGRGLGNSRHIHHLLFINPAQIGDKFFPQQRDNNKTAAEGEGADHEGGRKQCPV